MVPVESPTGARYQQNTEFADKSSKFHWFITDACKNPEAAFKVGDFLMGDEASLICCFGPEGTFWGELEEEKDSIIGGYKAKYWTNPDFSSDANSQAEKGHMYLGMHNDLTEFRASYTEMPEDLFTPDSYEARLIVETQKLEPYFYEEYIPKLNILLEGEEAETFNDLRGTLQEYVKTAMAQFITGERNIEKEWDSYVEEVHAYDSDTYVELLQKARDLYMGE